MANATAARAECRPVVCAKIMSKMSNNILWGAFFKHLYFQLPYKESNCNGYKTPNIMPMSKSDFKKGESFFLKRAGTLSSDPEGIDCFITVHWFKIHSELIFLVDVFGDLHSWGLHGTANIAM